MILFGDIESTGINPMCDEVITGYFALYDEGKIIKDYELKSQVNHWCDEAAKIHGISKSEMICYPSKSEAWESFLGWLSCLPSFTFACFANPNTQLGNIIFDKAIIQNEIMLHQNQYRIEKIPFTPSVLNIYEMAKNSEGSGKFSAIRNPDTNRKSFSQINIYKSIFGEEYNAHDAEADVKAMIRVYEYLIDSESSVEINRQQLGLI